MEGKIIDIIKNGKDTLDGLPEDSTESQDNYSGDDYSQGDYYQGGGYGYDYPYSGEEVVPWGGVY